MINLIPNEEKKKKVKDFYFRLTIVSFFVLGFSMLIAVVAMLPAYFLSVEKKNLINSKLEFQKNEPVPEIDKKTTAAVRDLKIRLNLVEKTKASRYIPSQKIINEIMKDRMSDIKITQILYQDDSIKGRTVSINGSAPSRERLLLFKRALEGNTAFKKVELPISNFVKGSNIRFYLGLIPS
ncbi:MAG TPA: hypothetical protein VJC14_00035 [Candidatus Paceibacterota bacterium]